MSHWASLNEKRSDANSPVQSAVSKLIHLQVENSNRKESMELAKLDGINGVLAGDCSKARQESSHEGANFSKRVRWTANLVETKSLGPAVGHRWPKLVWRAVASLDRELD